MCDSIGIEPKPNNGTFRLPLKPIGLHSDEPTSLAQDHPDPTTDSTGKINESKLSDAPFNDNVGVDKAPSSDTTAVVAPVETAILIEIVSPEGIQSEARYHRILH